MCDVQDADRNSKTGDDRRAGGALIAVKNAGRALHSIVSPSVDVERVFVSGLLASVPSYLPRAPISLDMIRRHPHSPYMTSRFVALRCESLTTNNKYENNR